MVKAGLESRIVELEDELNKAKASFEEDRRRLEAAVGDKQELQHRVEDGERKVRHGRGESYYFTDPSSCGYRSEDLART